MLGDATFVAFIPVQDLARAREFYVDTMGLTLKEESPFAIVVEAHGTVLSLTSLATRGD